MTRFLLLLFIVLVLQITACSPNWDDAEFPEDQRLTELAFLRMSEHGDVEPVLEPNQAIENWYFRISGYSTSTVLNGPTKVTFSLQDASGITYTVDERTPEAVRDQMNTGDYGFATGKVVNLERDLAGGTIDAVLLLSEWRDKD